MECWFRQRQSYLTHQIFNINSTWACDVIELATLFIDILKIQCWAEPAWMHHLTNNQASIRTTRAKLWPKVTLKRLIGTSPKIFAVALLSAISPFSVTVPCAKHSKSSRLEVVHLSGYSIQTYMVFHLRLGHMSGIAITGKAYDFSVNLGTASNRMLILFKNKRTGTFTDNQAITLAVVWAGDFLGVSF